MKLVIDFSGLFYEQKFYIIEYYQCEIDGSTIKYSTTIVTKLPNHVDPTIDSRYETFKYAYGVNLSKGFHPINRFRKQLMKLFPKMHTVYVRNQYYHQLLTKFLGKDYSNIEYLEELGYSKDPIVMTNCPYHELPMKNYCAVVNATEMANWLVKNHQIPMETLRLVSQVQLVIHFNGYFSSRRYIFKELSIYGLDNRGVIIFHKLFVIKPVEVENTASVQDAYNEIIYNKYGIKWNEGFTPSSRINIALRQIIVYANGPIIYVSSLQRKNILQKVMGDLLVSVVCLNDFGYVHKMAPNHPKCTYHSHINPTKNVCVDDLNENMVDFVQKNQMFYPEVIENIKQFHSLSQHTIDLFQKTS